MPELIASFPPGKYSQNKDSLKAIFRECGYKYSGFYDAKRDGNKIIVCTWKHISRKGEFIRADFYGSGQKATFIISCDEDKIVILRDLFTAYGAVVTEYKPVTIDEAVLRSKAVQLINSWWTPLCRFSGEPEIFWVSRLAKSHVSKSEFIEHEYQKLKLGME